jgi:hypothetical protein
MYPKSLPEDRQRDVARGDAAARTRRAERDPTRAKTPRASRESTSTRVPLPGTVANPPDVMCVFIRLSHCLFLELAPRRHGSDKTTPTGQ